MLFRQLFDPETSTYTYLLADEAMREAVLIDPVREQLPRDVQLLEELELTLTHALETHVHADHVTGSGLLRGVLTVDLPVAEGDAIRFGRHALEVRETPGHTDGCVTYVCHEEGTAFTGDALLIRGCGRTDFQQGDARTLFASVREKILSLPDATRLYPGHDYKGRMVTTVAEEKRFNPRLGDAKSVEQFAELMGRLGLALPKRIDEAVPANMASGITEPEPASPSSLESDRWAPVLRTMSGVPVVESEWLEGHREEVRLIDVREHIEFCGPLGHIEGAELVPLAALAETARDWGRDAPIVTICAYGTRSGKAALLLSDQGFGRVAALHGGMARWAEDGRLAAEVMGDRVQEDPAVWQGMGI
jgi:glyoxylase-like metal-dependent hydrolase (beta-lactamase superfamily II)/rhodanese-related sulfurtransferase